MNTEELKTFTQGQEKAYQFTTAALLHSFTSVISYVNRLYMKPEGKILRYSRDYNACACKVWCEPFATTAHIDNPPKATTP